MPVCWRSWKRVGGNAGLLRRVEGKLRWGQSWKMDKLETHVSGTAEPEDGCYYLEALWICA